MIELNILIISFFIYGFCGWLWESFVLPFARGTKPINSGFLNGPVIPIYGFGAIFMVLLLERNNVKYPLFSLFIESGVLACVLEYITSFMMEKMFHRRWWDYTRRPFNVNGRICLEGFACFGFFGTVVVEWIQPMLDQKIGVYNNMTLVILSTILLTLLSVDTISTVIGLAKLDERIIELQSIIESEGEKYYEHLQKYRNDAIKKSYLVKWIIDRNDWNSDKIKKFREHSKYVERRLLKAFPFIIKKDK